MNILYTCSYNILPNTKITSVFFLNNYCDHIDISFGECGDTMIPFCGIMTSLCGSEMS